MVKFSFTARFGNWHHLRPGQTLVLSMYTNTVTLLISGVCAVEPPENWQRC